MDRDIADFTDALYNYISAPLDADGATISALQCAVIVAKKAIDRDTTVIIHCVGSGKYTR